MSVSEPDFTKLLDDDKPDPQPPKSKAGSSKKRSEGQPPKKKASKSESSPASVSTPSTTTDETEALAPKVEESISDPSLMSRIAPRWKISFFLFVAFMLLHTYTFIQYVLQPLGVSYALGYDVQLYGHVIQATILVMVYLILSYCYA